MKRRIFFTLILVVIGVVSFWPLSSFQFQNSKAGYNLQFTLNEKSKKIIKVWAALKVMNGVINVLQSAQIGGSFFVEASVNPLEFLAPIDNILDRVSDFLLLALGAVIMEKLLLSISGLIVFKVLIPIFAFLFILAIWLQKDKTKLNRFIPVFFLISASVFIAVPASLKLSIIVENSLFSNKTGELVESITSKGEDAENMQNEINSVKKVGKTILAFMTNAKELGDALIDDMLNFLIIFFVTYLVLPILTILGLVTITKYAAKIILTSTA